MGKQRPRVTFRGGHARAYTPAKTVNWERAAAAVIREAYGDGAPVDGPLMLHALAIAARPKRLMRKSDPDGRVLRTTKPDCDNVLKAVADALQLSGVIRDDCQISIMSIIGYYAAKNEGPSTVVVLSHPFRECLLPLVSACTEND